MTPTELLKITAHRPWEMPVGTWSFYQEWNRAIFLHYQVDKNEMEKFVPQDLEIDLFEEKAWVSVVAFSMEKIRPKGLPSFSPVSDFDEINIRTYVKSKTKSGVYFLSIEGGKHLSCMVAKGISELPYRFSTIRRGENSYFSQNDQFKDYLNIEFTVGKEIQEKTDLDRWLTERYALFQETETSLNQFEIHHVEWPIQELELKKLSLDYARFSKLLGQSPVKTHYSPGVQVLAWSKQKRNREKLLGEAIS